MMKYALLLGLLAAPSSAQVLRQNGYPLNGSQVFTGTFTVVCTGSAAFSVDSPTFIVDCGNHNVIMGKVSVATATVDGDLTAAGIIPNNNHQLTTMGTNSNQPGLNIVQYGANSSPGYITMSKTRAPHATDANTIVANGDRVGSIFSYAADGGSYVNMANIQFEVDGTPGSGDMPGRITFQTTPDGTAAATEKMRLTNDGRLGILNTTPIAALDVRSTHTVASGAFVFAVSSNTSGTLLNVAGSGAVTAAGVVAGMPGFATTGTLAQGTVGTCTLGLTTTSTGAITGCVTSDMRLKTGFDDLAVGFFDSLRLLVKFLRLHPMVYSWKDHTAHDAQVHYGFGAQEVKEVFPFAVVPTGNNGQMGVDPNAINALNTAVLQKLIRAGAAILAALVLLLGLLGLHVHRRLAALEAGR